jgi:hypothetical protein
MMWGPGTRQNEALGGARVDMEQFDIFEEREKRFQG